jgi:CheY-like chemotaxis protein/SOS-response transcriptional repressor LexA
MFSRKQHEMLVYIDRKLRSTGFSPSLDEIKQALTLKSKIGIYRLITALEGRGLISRLHGLAPGLKVRHVQEDAPPHTTEATPGEIWSSITSAVIPGSFAHVTTGEPLVDDQPQFEMSQGGHIAACFPYEMTREPAGTAALDPTEPIERNFSHASHIATALRIVAYAMDRGYLHPETMQHQEFVQQAIRHAHLLVANGLVLTGPAFAAAASDTADGPAIILPQEARAAKIIANSPPARQHILVVDDATDVLVTLEAFLANSGFVVVTAANGDAALRIIASDPLIAVLVTDFAMPGLSGVDLIAQAVSMRPNLKSLLITAYPNVDGLAELSSRVVVLHKPFRRTALIEQVSILVAEARPTQLEDVMEMVMLAPELTK